MIVALNLIMNHTAVDTLRVPNKQLVKFVGQVMVAHSVISSETAMFVMEMVTRLFVLAMIAISSRIMNRTTVGKLRAPNKQHVKFAGQTMVMHSVISLETATFVMITDMH